MIQRKNGIKIKTSTIDEAINLIFKKKKRYRELFLINSLTMNMIERLLLINELILIIRNLKNKDHKNSFKCSTAFKMVSSLLAKQKRIFPESDGS